MNDTGKFPQIPTKIRFIHVVPENYQTHYINGVYGAINTRGDFELNFFFEHTNIPKEDVMKVEGGQLKPEEQKGVDTLPMTRDFKVGVIVTPAQAKSIGDWIISTVNEFNKRNPIKK